jgi:hypothetical protein
MKRLSALCFFRTVDRPVCPGHAAYFHGRRGVFRFQYSPIQIRCVLRGRQDGEGGSSWIPADARSTQGRVCDDEDNAATAMACFAYPKSQFKGKSAFAAAAFFVAKVPGAPTPKTCFEGSPDWLIQCVQNHDNTLRQGQAFSDQRCRVG